MKRATWNWVTERLELISLAKTSFQALVAAKTAQTAANLGSNAARVNMDVTKRPNWKAEGVPMDYTCEDWHEIILYTRIGYWLSKSLKSFVRKKEHWTGILRWLNTLYTIWGLRLFQTFGGKIMSMSKCSVPSGSQTFVKKVCELCRSEDHGENHWKPNNSCVPLCLHVFLRLGFLSFHLVNLQHLPLIDSCLELPAMMPMREQSASASSMLCVVRMTSGKLSKPFTLFLTN